MNTMNQEQLATLLEDIYESRQPPNWQRCAHCKEWVTSQALDGCEFCAPGCSDEPDMGIYGDSKAEQRNGRRYEREMAFYADSAGPDAPQPKKPKTILRRAGVR